MGAQSSFDLAWNVSDILMGIEAMINIIAILLLGKWAIAVLIDYQEQKKKGLDPVFVASNIPGLPACECWNTPREKLEHMEHAQAKEAYKQLSDELLRD